MDKNNLLNNNNLFNSNNKLLNNVEKGLNIYSSFIYYASFIVILGVLSYNVYALINNSMEYNNNKNNNVNVICNIENIISKDVVGTTKSKSSFSISRKNIFNYKLKLSFDINNKKIIKVYDIKTKNIYNINDKINLIYNTDSKKFVENSLNNIIINVVIILVLSFLTFLFIKYKNEVKSFLLIKNILD